MNGVEFTNKSKSNKSSFMNGVEPTKKLGHERRGAYKQQLVHERSGLQTKTKNLFMNGVKSTTIKKKKPKNSLMNSGVYNQKQKQNLAHE